MPVPMMEPGDAKGDDIGEFGRPPEPEGSRLVAVARSHMQRLARHAGGTVLLGVVESGDVRCLDMLGNPGGRGGACAEPRAPLASTALGEALMLGMTRTRWAALHALACLSPADSARPPGTRSPFSGWPAFERRMIGQAGRGWTHALERARDLEHGEGASNACCVAAPVRDHRDQVIAALGVVVVVPGEPADLIVTLGPAARLGADGLSRELGWKGHDSHRQHRRWSTLPDAGPAPAAPPGQTDV